VATEQEERMRKLVVAVAVLGLFTVACGADEDPTLQGTGTGAPAATDDIYASPAASADHEMTPQGKVNDKGTETFTGTAFTVELEQDDFYFEPTYIKAPGGSTATVNLTNEGEAPHNFSIESLNIDQDVQPGEKKTVEVKLGTDTLVPFFCKFHKDSGMQGGFQLH
jgi:plastocyanin